MARFFGLMVIKAAPPTFCKVESLEVVTLTDAES
jgi:hypothetical protein